MGNEWDRIQRFDVASRPYRFEGVRFVPSNPEHVPSLLLSNSSPGGGIYIEHLEAHDLWSEIEK